MNFIFSYCRDSEHYANTTMSDEEGYDVPGDIPVGIYFFKIKQGRGVADFSLFTGLNFIILRIR